MATEKSRGAFGKPSSKTKSRVVAPRNPKLVRDEIDFDKVLFGLILNHVCMVMIIKKKQA